jgi:acyl-CoA reductase-like NAD-dependent aldehyde dehydrogenase
LVDALDPEVLQVVNGAVDETTALLDEKFDKIIYTGNGTVGKIVAKKAAEHLTPVLLELGGKSPVFITENYPNLKLAAKRVAMAKNSNAGQVCISPDYILAHESVYEDFIEALQSQYDKYYGDAKDEKGYGKIVHDRAFKRLESTLEDTQGKIVYQNGELNASSRFFPPTIVRDVTFEDSLMKDEIFGPILPVIKYSDLDDAIDKVITYHDTPLALYVFTKNKAQENKILSKIRSGAALVNDALVHAIVSELPFGGVGNSGQGNYHGIHGFNSFSHDRAYLNQPDWTESLFEASFPPVSNWDLKLSTFFLTPSENINRVGPVFKKQYWFHGLVLAAGLAGSYFGFAKSCKG